MHHFLERKSLEIRKDYKLYDKNGTYHWQDLSDYTHAQLKDLSKYYADMRGE